VESENKHVSQPHVKLVLALWLAQIFWRLLAGTDRNAEFIPQQRSVVNDLAE